MSFHIMGPMGQNQARHYVSFILPDGGIGDDTIAGLFILQYSLAVDSLVM